MKNKNIKLIVSIVSPIVLMLAGLYLFLLFRGAIAFDFGKTKYVETTAECVSVGHRIEKGTRTKRSGERRANNKDQYSLIYNYSYQVDGITYQASDRDTRELDDDQSYQKDIEDSQNDVGNTRTIYYNPEKPDQYSFYYGGFEESVSSTNWVMGIIAVLCLAMLLPTMILMVILSSVRRKRRR